MASQDGLNPRDIWREESEMQLTATDPDRVEVEATDTMSYGPQNKPVGGVALSGAEVDMELWRQRVDGETHD